LSIIIPIIILLSVFCSSCLFFLENIREYHLRVAANGSVFIAGRAFSAVSARTAADLNTKVEVMI